MQPTGEQRSDVLWRIVRFNMRRIGPPGSRIPPAPIGPAHAKLRGLLGTWHSRNSGIRRCPKLSQQTRMCLGLSARGGLVVFGTGWLASRICLLRSIIYRTELKSGHHGAFSYLCIFSIICICMYIHIYICMSMRCVSVYIWRYLESHHVTGIIGLAIQAAKVFFRFAVLAESLVAGYLYTVVCPASSETCGVECCDESTTCAGALATLVWPFCKVLSCAHLLTPDCFQTWFASVSASLPELEDRLRTCRNASQIGLKVAVTHNSKEYAQSQVLHPNNKRQVQEQRQHPCRSAARFQDLQLHPRPVARRRPVATCTHGWLG